MAQKTSWTRCSISTKTWTVQKWSISSVIKNP